MALKPLIATPAYGGVMSVNYVLSLLRLRDVLFQLDIEHQFYTLHDSLITRARNVCVDHFLASDCSHLFFIDADIGFEPAAFLRLLQSGYDVAAGNYALKTDDGFASDISCIGKVQEDGFAESTGLPTGFMCIKRDVFPKLLASGVWPNEYFDTMRLPDDYLSEDYAFCRRWRDIGGKCHVDSLCDLSHQGMKTYSRSLKEALNNRDR